VTLLPPPHDSGPMWFAKPSSYDSFIHDTLPVLTGAFGQSYIVPVKKKNVSERNQRKQ